MFWKGEIERLSLHIKGCQLNQLYITFGIQYVNIFSMVMFKVDIFVMATVVKLPSELTIKFISLFCFYSH